MRKYAIAFALLFATISAQAVCTSLPDGLKLDLPNFVNRGNIWAQ